jgi:hypothetical protein
MCTAADHAALKSDPARYAAETKHVGVQVIEGMPPLALSNCKRCNSTLAVPMVFDSIESAARAACGEAAL